MKGYYFIIGLVLSMVLFATPAMAASAKDKDRMVVSDDQIFLTPVMETEKDSRDPLKSLPKISPEGWSLIKTWNTHMERTGDEHMSGRIKTTNSGNYRFQLISPAGVAFELYVYSSYSRRWYETHNQVQTYIPSGYYYNLHVESYRGSGWAKVQVYKQS